MYLHVFASTPVVSSFEVVTKVGYLDFGSIKLSNCAFPSESSPVIFITYLESLRIMSLFSFTSACLILEACSMSMQKKMDLSNLLLVSFNISDTYLATFCVRSSITIFLSKSILLNIRSGTSYPFASTLFFSGR